jgi:L-lactate dehydrogenase complex protein LldE
MPPASWTPDRVYFFGTCLIDSFYPEAGLAAIRLILAFGVHGPKELIVLVLK